MPDRIIKVRLFTWFEEVPNQVQPNGDPVYTERIAHLGEKVNITNQAYIKRGEELNAFYTAKEAKAIEAGTYDGDDAAIVFAARGGSWTGPPVVTPAEGEHGDVAMMDAPTLGQYIADNKLKVGEVLALVPEDADDEMLQKFIDAENIATDNSPRSGVIEALEQKQLAAEEPEATPAAKELAEANNLDLSQVKGTGTGGRITQDDVKAALGENGS